MEAMLILERPIISEKAMDMAHQAKYVFRVAKAANKIEIARAVEQRFNVAVVDVNTMNVRGKPRRVGRNSGHTPAWKKAIVTLKKGQTIQVIQGV
jgi:large subunit ribosomal protein L23